MNTEGVVKVELSSGPESRKCRGLLVGMRQLRWLLLTTFALICIAIIEPQLIPTLFLVSLAYGSVIANRSIQPVLRFKDAGNFVDIVQSVTEVIEIDAISESNGLLVLGGSLKIETEDAFARLKTILKQHCALPLLQGSERNVTLIVVPDHFIRSRSKTWPLLHIGLGLATLVTTTLVGAKITGCLAGGFQYALALLSILGLHELGHFVAARCHKMDVTPPFFIPIPFGLGTFGAFIQLRSPAENRRGLFDVAISGPLAGFAMALPLLFFGLQESVIVHQAHPILKLDQAFWDGVPASSSLLLTALCNIAQPGMIRFGDIIHFNPMALAGWIGIWITALNLIPIGQLDGGHTAHAVVGGRFIRKLNLAMYWILIMGGLFYWPGLLTWALLVYLIAGESVPPLNDITSIDRKRKLLAVFALCILLSTFCPVAP